MIETNRKMGNSYLRHSFVHAVRSTKKVQAPACIFLLLMSILLTAVAHGQRWTRFRGPNGQGISPPQADRTIPIKWHERDHNWKIKLPAKGYGSPVWINGSLYCMDRAGAIVVIEAAPTYRLLTVNALGEGSQATPAVAGGRMYLRTYSRLISIGD